MKREERGKRELFVVGKEDPLSSQGKSMYGKKSALLLKHIGGPSWGNPHFGRGKRKQTNTWRVVIHTAAHLPTPARPPPRMEREAHLRAGGGMRPGSHGKLQSQSSTCKRCFLGIVEVRVQLTDSLRVATAGGQRWLLERDGKDSPTL